MRTSVLAAIAFAVAAAAVADDAPKPDYSRRALLRMFAPPLAEPPLPPGRVRWHVGYAQYGFRALGMDWRVTFVYLPVLAPLPGSRPSDLATPPDPFALTGTPYASTMPPMFDHDRSWAVEREFRRIERLTRAKQ